MGKQIDISIWQLVDSYLGTNYVEQIQNDLSEITGLSVTTDENGFLQYVDTGSEKGSPTAKDFLKKMIDDEGIVKVGYSQTKSATGEGNELFLGVEQITGFIEGTPTVLNDKTMGWGMTLLHELFHTQLGGGLIDVKDENDFNSTGPTVDEMNQIRRELDDNPQNNRNGYYGERTHYNSRIDFYGVASIEFKYLIVKPNGKKRTNHTNIKMR